MLAAGPRMTEIVPRRAHPRRRGNRPASGVVATSALDKASGREDDGPMEVGNSQAHDHDFGKGATASSSNVHGAHAVEADPAALDGSHAATEHHASHGLFGDVAHEVAGTGLDALDLHHDPVDHTAVEHDLSGGHGDP
jgi:hypothetical protein